jgi:hypothetical protein
MKVGPVILMFLITLSVSAQISIAPNGRYLQPTDGKPFFWLEDTDWEMFHRLTAPAVFK